MTLQPRFVGISAMIPAGKSAMILAGKSSSLRQAAGNYQVKDPTVSRLRFFVPRHVSLPKNHIFRFISSNHTKLRSCHCEERSDVAIYPIEPALARGTKLRA